MLYPPAIADNVPKMLVDMTFVWSLLILVSLLLITRKPKDEHNPSLAEQIKNKKAKPVIEFPELGHWYYCFYSKPFWQLFLMLTLSGYFRTLFSYTFKSYGSTSDNGAAVSERLMTWAAAIGGGFFNGASRLSFGILVDKWSFKKIFSCVLAVQLANALTCYYSKLVPACYFVAILINYTCLGATLTMSPVATCNIYGLKLGPQVYVMVLFGQIVSSLFNVLTLEVVFPVLSGQSESTVAFRDLYFLGALLTGAALVILYFFREELDTARMERLNLLAVPKQGDKASLLEEPAINRTSVN